MTSVNFIRTPTVFTGPNCSLWPKVDLTLPFRVGAMETNILNAKIICSKAKSKYKNSYSGAVQCIISLHKSRILSTPMVRWWHYQRINAKKGDIFLYSYKNCLKQPVLLHSFFLALSSSSEICTKALLLVPRQGLTPLPWVRERRMRKDKWRC